MKLLITTHSSRWFESQRGSLNALNERFQNRVLENLPPLDSFPPVGEAIQVTGAVAFWRLEPPGAAGRRVTLLKVLRPAVNPQSVCFIGDKLAIAGPDRVMLYAPGFEELTPLTDPWIAGCHTVKLAEDGTIWVTSAPANAALRLDPGSGRVVERLIMPARYGVGHALTPEDDLRTHFITTDYQPTHINSAVPVGGGLLVSMLVPGAVGFFDEARTYREIAGGMRGCHGARVHPRTGEIYASDSPTGLVWFFDRESGRPTRRLDFGSRWLHDALILDDGAIVGLASDRNEILFLDEAGKPVAEPEKCDGIGRSPLFVNCEEAPEAWVEALMDSTAAAPSVEARVRFGKTLNLTSETFSSGGRIADACRLAGFYELSVGGALSQEYLWGSADFKLGAGNYRFQTRAKCDVGGISIGLIDQGRDCWIVACTHDTHRHEDWLDFALDRPTKARLVIAAFNADRPGEVKALVKQIVVMTRL